ncbi:protein SLX4IP [Danio aesculapii]|uniref:protein SLX4IP n=1 Tax=Danio aesculapii TaxID=1142201 RepID=UPI0024C0822F|nr:protein SLX4IP [Danio aesculapii]
MEPSKFVVKCGNYAVLVDLHILALGEDNANWFSPAHRKEVGSLIRDAVEPRVRQFQEARYQKIQSKPRKDLTPTAPLCLEGGNVRLAVHFMKRHVNLRCIVRQHYRELRVFPERVVVCASPPENSALPNGNLNLDVCEQSQSKYFSNSGENAIPLPSSAATKRAVLQKIARKTKIQSQQSQDIQESKTGQFQAKNAETGSRSVLQRITRQANVQQCQDDQEPKSGQFQADKQEKRSGDVPQKITRQANVQPQQFQDDQESKSGQFQADLQKGSGDVPQKIDKQTNVQLPQSQDHKESNSDQFPANQAENGSRSVLQKIVKQTNVQPPQSQDRQESNSGQFPADQSEKGSRSVLQKIAKQTNTQPPQSQDDQESKSEQFSADELEKGSRSVHQKIARQANIQSPHSIQDDQEFKSGQFQVAEEFAEACLPPPMLVSSTESLVDGKGLSSSKLGNNKDVTESNLDTTGPRRRPRAPSSSGEDADHQKTKRLRLGQPTVSSDSNNPSSGIAAQDSVCSPQPEISQTNQSGLATSLRGLSVKPVSSGSSISSRPAAREGRKGGEPRTSRLRRLKKS